MAARAKITDRDRGYKALMRRIGRVAKGKPEVVVGVFGEAGAAAHRGSAATVVDVAIWAELGVGQPRRSWLRDWFDEQLPENKAKIRTVAAKVLTGELDEKTGLDLLGLEFVGKIRERITAGIEPPNAPSTIERKGSSTPLVDTGQLLQSITHEVRL